MPLVSVVVPTFNEENNVEPLFLQIKDMFEQKLSSYDYEVIFIDNLSSDGTRARLRELAGRFGQVKCIFNKRNFGQFNSPYYGLLNSGGDCCILLCADFQDPPELIPDFIKLWEDGSKVVVGVKKESRESRFMYFARGMYYKLLRRFSDTGIIEHFTGFGLYDREFIDTLKSVEEPAPFLRAMVGELGYSYKTVEYVQNKRFSGKSSNNFMRLYDAGMLGITTYTKFLVRAAVFFGIILCGLFLIPTVFLLAENLFDASDDKLLYLLLCFFGVIFGFQTFFTGILGEYIITLSRRVSNRPLVVEDERINF